MQRSVLVGGKMYRPIYARRPRS